MAPKHPSNLKKIYYYKLIRDKIPEKIKKNGGEYKVMKLARKPFERELLKKIVEESEALGVATNKEEFLQELADVLIVIEEIIATKRIKSTQIIKALKDNETRKGGFKKKLFLVWSSDTGYKTNERKGLPDARK